MVTRTLHEYSQCAWLNVPLQEIVVHEHTKSPHKFYYMVYQMSWAPRTNPLYSDNKRLQTVCIGPRMSNRRHVTRYSAMPCFRFRLFRTLQLALDPPDRPVAASWVNPSVGCSGLTLSAVPSGDGRRASCFHQLSPRRTLWSVPRGGGLCWPCTLRRYHRTEPTRAQGACPGVGWRHHRVRRRKFVLWFVYQL